MNIFHNTFVLELSFDSILTYGCYCNSKESETQEMNAFWLDNRFPEMGGKNIHCSTTWNLMLGGSLIYFLRSSLLGEMIQIE